MLPALVLAALCAPIVLPDRDNRVGHNARPKAVGATPALNAAESSDGSPCQTTARQAAAAAAAFTASGHSPIATRAPATRPTTTKCAPKHSRSEPTTVPTIRPGRWLRRHGPARPNGGAAAQPPKTFDHKRRARGHPRGIRQPGHLQVDGAPDAHIGVPNSVDDYAGHTRASALLL